MWAQEVRAGEDGVGADAGRAPVVRVSGGAVPGFEARFCGRTGVLLGLRARGEELLQAPLLPCLFRCEGGSAAGTGAHADDRRPGTHCCPGTRVARLQGGVQVVCRVGAQGVHRQRPRRLGRQQLRRPLDGGGAGPSGALPLR